MRTHGLILMILISWGGWTPTLARQAARTPPPRLNVQEPMPPQAGQIALTRMAILRLLNLRPEQRQRIREIRDRYAPQLRQLRQEVEERRDALREAIYGEAVDPERVEQNLRGFLEKHGALIRLETQLEIEFRQVLTPEQLAKFREIQREELNIRRLRRELRQREGRLRERLRRGS